jgi:hypothetical protein
LRLISAARLVTRAPGGLVHRARVVVPFGVLAVVQLLALAQYVHIASPILPETTVFDRGADALWDR